MSNLIFTNLIILISLLQYLVLILLIKFSYNFNFFLAIPNLRSAHQKVKPRNGGIAIFISFIFFIIFYNNIFNLHSLFFLVVIFFIGLIDDYKSLNFKIKLLLQVISVSFILINNFDFFDIQFYLLIFVLIYFINIINFMDGADGYLSINNILVLLSILFYLNYFDLNNIFVSRFIYFYLLINFVFLIFNLYPSKIFLGDSGSYLHAGILIIILFEIHKINLNILILTILCFMPYFIDSLLTIFLRLKKHKNIFHAHKEHIYQLYLTENHNYLVVQYMLYYIFNFLIVFVSFTISKNLYSPIIMSIILNSSTYIFLFFKKNRINY